MFQSIGPAAAKAGRLSFYIWSGLLFSYILCQQREKQTCVMCLDRVDFNCGELSHRFSLSRQWPIPLHSRMTLCGCIPSLLTSQNQLYGMEFNSTKGVQLYHVHCHVNNFHRVQSVAKMFLSLFEKHNSYRTLPLHGCSQKYSNYTSE